MIKSFATGIRQASRSWKMILFLLVTNALVALPLALPVFLLIRRTAGGNLFARRMFADQLDAVWFSDVLNAQVPGVSLEAFSVEMLALLAALGGVYLILNTLLTGGILAVYAEGGRFTMGKFWAGCGVYCWRFFRLLLVSLIYYGLAIGAYLLWLWPINAADHRAVAEQPVVLERYAAGLGLLLLLAFVNLVFDYAKLGAVVGERRKMFRESLRAARFALRYFGRTFGLYLAVALTGLIVFAGFTWLRSLTPQTSLADVMLAVIIGQLALAARLWARLACYAAELDLYRRLIPAPPTAEESAAPEAEPLALEPEPEPSLTGPEADGAST